MTTRINSIKRDIKRPGTPEHRTTEHGTPAKYRNSGRTLMELWNTGGKTDHWRNKWNKRTPT